MHRKPQSQEHEDLDVAAIAFTILVAGYDTTAQALAYAGPLAKTSFWTWSDFG